MRSLVCPSRRSSRRLGMLTISITIVIPTTAAAQYATDARAGLRATPAVVGDTARASGAERSKPPALETTLASAVLPGGGQLMLKQKRAAAYLGVEAAGLVYHLSAKREGRRERDTYRRIATTIARADFSPNGPRGDWDYHERMGKFVASGAFDLSPGGELDPETDTETYNGTVWLLARQTYWRDASDPPARSSPEYTAALGFYSGRAVRDDMRWSWAGQPEAFQGFRSAIDASNSAFRSATHAASIVLANHFLSAVDAYVSVNMRIRRLENGSLSFTASIPAGY